MDILPPYASRELIHERLPQIFPEGTPNRNYCIREMAASTIFTMNYIGAVDGQDTYIGPVHVYRMTVEQASLTSEEDRLNYAKTVIKKGFQAVGTRWYADNTREPIRDETLREGLCQVGAVISLKGLPTTSSKPRYALQSDFASLFDPNLISGELEAKIEQWQKNYLSKGALSRIALAGRISADSEGRVLITFPNGESKNMSAGPSSEISKAVIEVFAPLFLENPAVLWLSASDAKVQYSDEILAKKIGLDIKADKDLIDIILVDFGPDDPILVFIEVVATDGPVSERRKEAVYSLTDKAGFDRAQIAFVTAYHDRQSAGFKKTISALAWNSFSWFLSEPHKILYMKDGTQKIGVLTKY